jgi:ribosomal protein S18 acetylase RimI-like enzyme
MPRIDPGRAGAAAWAGDPDGAVRIRLLGRGDMRQVERHLLALDMRDRRARFHAAVSDWMITAYVSQLDPKRVVLVGAVGRATGRLIGLAEAHPAASPHTVEMAVTVEPPCRRRGLGQRLVAQALARAFASGAETAEFLFTHSNAALAGLAAALGAKVDMPRGYAAISRVAHAGAWQGAV